MQVIKENKKPVFRESFIYIHIYNSETLDQTLHTCTPTAPTRLGFFIFFILFFFFLLLFYKRIRRHKWIIYFDVFHSRIYVSRRIHFKPKKKKKHKNYLIEKRNGVDVLFLLLNAVFGIKTRNSSKTIIINRRRGSLYRENKMFSEKFVENVLQKRQWSMLVRWFDKL